MEEKIESKILRSTGIGNDEDFKRYNDLMDELAEGKDKEKTVKEEAKVMETEENPEETTEEPIDNQDEREEEEMTTEADEMGRRRSTRRRRTTTKGATKIPYHFGPLPGVTGYEMRGAYH